MKLIELRDITKTYHLGEIDVPVLKGVSLDVNRGELVALMGASDGTRTELLGGELKEGDLVIVGSARPAEKK